MTKRDLIEKFDTYIESRTSIVLNWCWKSGLLIFLIGLVWTHLGIQKQNTREILLMKYKQLICEGNISNNSQLVKNNSDKLSKLTGRVYKVESQVDLLRHEVKFTRTKEGS